MIAPRIAFWFLAAAILAGCAIPVRTDSAVEDRMVIRGNRIDASEIFLNADFGALQLRFEIDPEGRLVLHTTRQQSIAARR
jgi:hypothetical protein